MESIQCNAAVVIKGAIRGSSGEKFYQELGLESLQQDWWYRKLCYFLKLIKKNLPSMYSIISQQLEIHTEQETLTIFLNSMLDLPFSEIHTSYPL